MPHDLFTVLTKGPTGPVTMFAKEPDIGKTPVNIVEGKDNENFVDKTLTLGKFSFAGAFACFAIDVIGYNNKGGLPVAFQRMKYHFTPWMGATVAYTATVNAVCNLRGGKSDQLNHILGGFAAGAVVGKHARSGIFGFTSGCLFAFIGGLYKDSVMEGYQLWDTLDNIPPEHGNPFVHKNDFTTGLFKPRPGYWARSEEDVPRVYQQGQLGDGNPNRRYW